MMHPTILLLSLSPPQSLHSLSLSLLTRSPQSTIHFLLPASQIPSYSPHPSLHFHPLPTPCSFLTCPITSKPIICPITCKPIPLPSSNPLRRTILSAIPAILRLAHSTGPSLILSHGPLSLASHTVAQHLCIPLVILNALPLTPTRVFPCLQADTKAAKLAAKLIAGDSGHPCHNDDASTASSGFSVTSFSVNKVAPSRTREKGYLSTYAEHLKRLYGPLLGKLNVVRNGLELPDMTLVSLVDLLSGKERDVHILNVYPKKMRVANEGLGSGNVYWVNGVGGKKNWKWNEDVVEYLRWGGQPFCVRIGGAVGKSEWKEIVKGMKRMGLKRIIVFGGDKLQGVWGKGEEDIDWWERQHVWFCEESGEVAWMLEYCCGMMCYVGEEKDGGVVLEGIEAGIPVIVVGNGGVDAAFWGKLVEEWGVGREVVGGIGAKWGSYGKALTGALSLAIRRTAADTGKQMRAAADDGREISRILESFGREGLQRSDSSVPWF